MTNKPQTKKQWQAPEIIDLDVKNTESGPTPDSYEGLSLFSTFSYYPSSS